MRKGSAFKKVLLMTVGTGKSGDDISHGLSYSINVQNPDYLYLILSSKSKEQTFPSLKKYLEEHKPDTHLEIFEYDEVNDVQKLQRKYLEYLKQIVEQGFDKNNISIDYTSGTKAMSAALVSAAISIEAGNISYVYGDRGEGGRVMSGTERVSTLTPSAIFTSRRINQAIALFNKYQFEAAIEILNMSENHPDFNQVAETLLLLSEIYSLWDRFNFNICFDKIKLVLNYEALKKLKIKMHFEKHKKLISLLTSEDLNYEKVFDLYYNALRRGEEGKYDDAVARLYRLMEMIAQIEFKRKFNCSTDDVNLEEVPAKYNKSLKIKYFNSRNNKIQIGLVKAFELLNDIDNPIGINFLKDKRYKKLLNMRNYSILAHGSTPIGKVKYEKFKNFIKDNLLNQITENKLQENFSFLKMPVSF